MDTTLLIMAAGLGSRFGGGVKQLAPVGLHGEIIMDYSIHDAIEAGFNKIVFVIRKDIASDFRECIGERIEEFCSARGVQTAYAFQDLYDIPEGFSVPEGRAKPWGTGQAVLAAKELLHEPFMVINADDYYGKNAYVQLHDWLIQEHAPSDIAMAGFVLENTLSDNGGVTRGICYGDQDTHMLSNVVETKNIQRTADGIESDGNKLSPRSCVSMNMWAFPGEPPKFLELLEERFTEFFRTDVPVDPMKAEYLLPTLIGGLLREGKCSVKMLPTYDKWFGVTYKEDVPSVIASFRELIASGTYQEKLYSDL